MPVHPKRSSNHLLPSNAQVGRASMKYQTPTSSFMLPSARNGINTYSICYPLVPLFGPEGDVHDSCCVLRQFEGRRWQDCVGS